MQVTLRVTSGPSTGRAVRLQAGQVAQIGRTEWADFSIPDDAKLSDVHFALQCTPNECRIRDLNSASGTKLDGKPVTDEVVHSGNQISAGSTTFIISIEGEPAQTDAAQAAAVPNGTMPDDTPDPEAGEPPPQTAAELCEVRQITLSDDGKKLLKPEQTPLQFVDALVAGELFLDAKQVLAHALPKREAVWWGCLCVREGCGTNLPPGEPEALQAAEEWVAEPSEANRRKAEAAADTVDFKGAGGWLAKAVFWSGGSLTPADAPAVPPDEGLTASALSPALTKAAIHGSPIKATERYRKFLAIGKEIAEGKIELPGGTTEAGNSTADAAAE